MPTKIQNAMLEENVHFIEKKNKTKYECSSSRNQNCIESRIQLDFLNGHCDTSHTTKQIH